MDNSTTDSSFQAAFESALEWWDAMGVDVPKLAPSRPKPRTAKPKPSQQHQKTAYLKAATQPSNDTHITQAQKIADAAKDLSALKTAMSGFDAGALSDNATQCVFSRGNPESGLMVIGEAPGRDEDIAGKPFVGRSGQLLDSMLAAIGLTEDAFYMTNVVNWRPPGNRNPARDEIALCQPFLRRHIELIAPKIILIVGGVSLAIPALPIYHPAFLLKRPELKREAWRDLLSLHEKLSELG